MPDREVGMPQSVGVNPYWDPELVRRRPWISRRGEVVNLVTVSSEWLAT